MPSILDKDFDYTNSSSTDVTNTWRKFGWVPKAEAKTFVKQFKEETADEQYCWFCLELRDGKLVCCSASNFIKLKDLHQYDQDVIVNKEYARNVK